MNLQPTTGREFSCKCAGCSRHLRAGTVTHGETVYADLDGLPFTDYYCGVCAGEQRAAARAALAKVSP